MKNEAVFGKDLKNKRLTVTRTFDAPLQPVWKAWTESEILDQWWAPKPYRAETKSMVFRKGGTWLYCMAGPQGDRSWCRVDFKAIDIPNSISSTTAFCDEDGKITNDFPGMDWKISFHESAGSTTVKVEILFAQEADMEKIIATGFREGFAAGLNNLEQYLSAGFQIR